MPVIPAFQKAEVGGSQVQVPLGQISRTLCWNKKMKRARLSPIPSPRSAKEGFGAEVKHCPDAYRPLEWGLEDEGSWNPGCGVRSPSHCCPQGYQEQQLCFLDLWLCLKHQPQSLRHSFLLLCVGGLWPRVKLIQSLYIGKLSYTGSLLTWRPVNHLLKMCTRALCTCHREHSRH